MVQNSYYPEEVLIEKMESGEYGWLDYVNHFSAEWQEELAAYCAELFCRMAGRTGSILRRTRIGNQRCRR